MNNYKKSYNTAKDLFKNRSEENCVFAIELLDRDVCLEHLSKETRCKNHQLFTSAWVLRDDIWHHLLASSKDKYWNKYLESPAWKWKCDNALNRDNHKCSTCGEPAEKVYHKRDDKLGKAPLSDLVSLCKDCYEKRTREG